MNDPVLIQDFTTHLKTIKNKQTGIDNFDYFINELDKITISMQKKEYTGVSTKNRYSNILCYEGESRFKLSEIDGIVGTDYINASWIKPPEITQNKYKYIATQAPLWNTVDDFWRMIWESGSVLIVMLSREVEKGEHKCFLYWPDENRIIVSQVTGIKVEHIPSSTTINQDFITRRIKVSKGDSSRIVTQIQYVGWTDHGSPQSNDSMLKFMMEYRIIRDKIDPKNPILTHCSAGVGRSGSFLALDVTLDWIVNQQTYNSDNGKIDILDLISSFRKARPRMVETKSQLEFVYFFIEYALINGLLGCKKLI